MPASNTAQSKTLATQLNSLQSKQQFSHHDEEVLVSPSTRPPTSICGLFATPTSGSDDMFSGNLEYHGDHRHGSAPCDGNTVWFCCRCGDGPIGSWQTVCMCGYAYCGACRVEETA